VAHAAEEEELWRRAWLRRSRRRHGGVAWQRRSSGCGGHEAVRVAWLRCRRWHGSAARLRRREEALHG
jgi:hypothetical protein